MSALSILRGRLADIRAEHARQDEDDERRLRHRQRAAPSLGGVVVGSSSPGTEKPGRGFGRAKPAFDEYDDRVPRGTGARIGFGAATRAGERSQTPVLMRLPDGPKRASGLASGGQSAVIKVVSFAAGSTRVGALAAYVTRDREGGVITEDQDAVVLDDKAVAATLSRWKESYSGRAASKDVATLRLDVKGAAGLDRQAVEAAVGRSLAGHRHALRTRDAGVGAFEVSVVVVAEGRTTGNADGKVKRQARYRFDKRFEAFVAGKVAAEIGGEIGGLATVEAVVTGTSHGRDGAAHQLSRLVTGGPAVDEQGRMITSVSDARTHADDWKTSLRSRKARDAMHLVLSAKAGTDATAFRQTARDVLASEFAGHEYVFAVHNDRGHLHAHAVILVRGDDGQRIRPDISTFAHWRARYAEVAQSHGIHMVATRRSDTASPPPFDQAEAGLTARGVAPDHIRRKVDAKRSNAVHVPVRAEGRKRIEAAYRHWRQAEATAATPAAAARVSDALSRLATAINLSHSSQGRAIAVLPIEQRSKTMARVTAEYLTAEFNRANKVLNQALPLLEGADKVQATEIANAYLAALAKQVEAVQAIERGQLTGRSPGDGRLPDAATPAIAAGIGERTVVREQAEVDVRSQEEQALRSNPVAPDPGALDGPGSTEALRDEQDLLIDRIETQHLSHRPVQRL